jgi:hypothetical protein
MTLGAWPPQLRAFYQKKLMGSDSRDGRRGGRLSLRTSIREEADFDAEPLCCVLGETA